MELLKKIVLIFITLLISTPVWATDYYVKNGGSDALTGLSDAQAWETIAKVQATVVAGDTVYFRSQDTWEGGTGMLFPIAGTDNTHRTTYDGSTYGAGTRATFLATSRTSSYAMVQIRVSNVTFQGFKVDGAGMYHGQVGIGWTSPTPAGNIENITVHNCEVTNNVGAEPGSTYWYYGLHASMSSPDANPRTASNLTITNNWVHHVGHEGITVYPATSSSSRVDTVLVRNNIIHNTGTSLSAERGSPFEITNDADNVTAEFNYIYDNSSGISITSYGPAYSAPSPDNVIVRYNILYNNDGGGISINDYFGHEGIDGSGEIYGNIFFYGKLSIAANDFHGKSWKIYNNIFITDYSAGKGSYVLDSFMYKSPINATGVEIKNNIFQGTGLNLVRDPEDALGSTGGIVHSNNLFYRTDSASNVVLSAVLSDASAIPSTEVSVTNDDSYTYFTKSGGTDWTTKFAVNEKVKWAGFTNPEFNRLFNISAISADQIRTSNAYLRAGGPTETTTVTGEKWVGLYYSAAQIQSTWEPTAQITNPTFTAGTLPTGFTGTYGTNMVPNTNYFAISSGNALNNGATLGSPYNGCINGAGVSPVLYRVGVYDIGAYELNPAGAGGSITLGAGSQSVTIGGGSLSIVW